MPTGIYKRKLELIKIGEKFNRLTILKEVEPYICPKGIKTRKVLCRCDCGNTKKIKYQSLKTGYTKSCGCLKKENNFNYKHGMEGTRFYSIWLNMKNRCFNKKVKSYQDYGNKGIIVCKKWKNSFINFRNDMHSGYLKHCKEFTEKNTSIDRIDNNGNYCPENCRWATWKKQMNNTCRNRFLIFKGQNLTMAQWENKLNFRSGALHYRLSNNWSIEKALTTPIKK